VLSDLGKLYLSLLMYVIDLAHPFCLCLAMIVWIVTRDQMWF